MLVFIVGAFINYFGPPICLYHRFIYKSYVDISIASFSFEFLLLFLFDLVLLELQFKNLEFGFVGLMDHTKKGVKRYRTSRNPQHATQSAQSASFPPTTRTAAAAPLSCQRDRGVVGGGVLLLLRMLTLQHPLPFWLKAPLV